MSIMRFFFSVFSVVFILWTAGFIAYLTHSASLAPPQTDAKVDAVIVLTGGQNRIRTGLDLFSSGLAPNLFITGVHKDVSRKDVLTQRGISNSLPECCVILGHKATTTRENAQETYEWVYKTNIHNVYLVTSAYHMNRALLEFRHAMPDLTVIPYPVTENGKALKSVKFWTLVFSEYNKFIFRKLAIVTERAM